jgi:hypothetical protein
MRPEELARAIDRDRRNNVWTIIMVAAVIVLILVAWGRG